MKNLELGSPVFWTARKEFVSYIAYWEERDKVIFAYDLFSIKRYDEVSSSKFEKEFLTEKEKVREYIQNLIRKEKEENLIKIPDKVFKKLDLLKIQQECMLKLEKPNEDIKKGERNIKRQNKKIARYFERNEEMKKEIDYKYLGLWENFGCYFGD